MIRLWVHEISRVFFDRLSFEQDQMWFYNTLTSTIRNKIKDDLKTVLKGTYDQVKYNILTPDPIKVIRFGELLSNQESDRPYEEMVQTISSFVKFLSSNKFVFLIRLNLLRCSPKSISF